MSGKVPKFGRNSVLGLLYSEIGNDVLLEREKLLVWAEMIMDLSSDVSFTFLHILEPKMKIVAFANSTDPDEVAHNEPPHLDLCCLLSIH